MTGAGPSIDASIINDTIFEKDEYFSVHISSEPNVMIAMSYFNVTIHDDEGNAVNL